MAKGSPIVKNKISNGSTFCYRMRDGMRARERTYRHIDLDGDVLARCYAGLSRRRCDDDILRVCSSSEERSEDGSGEKLHRVGSDLGE